MPGVFHSAAAQERVQRCCSRQPALLGPLSEAQAGPNEQGRAAAPRSSGSVTTAHPTCAPPP